MRTLRLALLSGLILVFACDSTPEITGPEPLDPAFHLVNGDPASDDDNSYSMYYFDLDLQNDLVMKMAQTASNGLGIADYMCEGISSSHEGPIFLELPENPGWKEATGFGWFVNRRSWPWKSGYLKVTDACWFDEWNDGGFPESALVAGTVRIGWRIELPFAVILKSGGFPDPSHLNPLSLDWASLLVNAQAYLTLPGELHHEDGITLIR